MRLPSSSATLDAELYMLLFSYKISTINRKYSPASFSQDRQGKQK
jgi:hypothetical protein